MICGNLLKENHAAGLTKTLAGIINQVNRMDLVNLEPGRYEIDGDNVYVNVMAFAAKPATEKQGELHHDYLDIQILLAGEERIDYSVIDSGETTDTYHQEGDYQMIDRMPGESSLLMRPGMFVIFFPHEPHKPGCQIDGEQHIKKAVVKVHKRLLVND